MGFLVLGRQLEEIFEFKCAATHICKSALANRSTWCTSSNQALPQHISSPAVAATLEDAAYGRCGWGCC
jgi:hypothetical protein